MYLSSRNKIDYHEVSQLTIRTAVYGPVCTVVWEGGAVKCLPIPSHKGMNINDLQLITVYFLEGYHSRNPRILLSISAMLVKVNQFELGNLIFSLRQAELLLIFLLTLFELVLVQVVPY